jgi:hypothetical protein
MVIRVKTFDGLKIKKFRQAGSGILYFEALGRIQLLSPTGVNLISVPTLPFD